MVASFSSGPLTNRDAPDLDTQRPHHIMSIIEKDKRRFAMSLDNLIEATQMAAEAWDRIIAAADDPERPMGLFTVATVDVCLATIRIPL